MTIPSSLVNGSLTPRGPLTDLLLSALAGTPGPISAAETADDPLSGDDFHLALYLCYELHYRGLPGVDERWEWEPALIAFRRRLEEAFEQEVRSKVVTPSLQRSVPEALRQVIAADTAPSLADYMDASGTLTQMREFIVHRSAYQLKEADPHSWVIPRLTGRSKAALVEIQADEYGSGRADRIHAHLFAESMAALGLDPAYGAYLDVIPGVTLATVNLVSMFGLNRRLRAAAIGHLALFEMTSSVPNRKYANALRRLGFEKATPFFDEHVEADAVHEVIASHDMAGSLADDEPGSAEGILFGAHASMYLEGSFAAHLMDAWSQGATSLYEREVAQQA